MSVLVPVVILTVVERRSICERGPQVARLDGAIAVDDVSWISGALRTNRAGEFILPAAFTAAHEATIVHLRSGGEVLVEGSPASFAAAVKEAGDA